MSHYIIVANGNFLVREIIAQAIKDKIIIALDGAADKLLRIDIKPQYILGDFDSISEATKHYCGIRKSFSDLSEQDEAYLGNHGITIVPAKNQQYTDLAKAIQFCDRSGASSITIVCAVGGRLDHHESAVRLLRTAYKKDRPILLHTEQQTLRFAKDETVLFSGEIGDKCGIVAFPKGCVSSQGLEYESDHYELNFGYSENTCNSLLAQQASVTITDEALLIMPPQLSAQREFMAKSEIERLEMQLRDACGNSEGVIKKE